MIQIVPTGDLGLDVLLGGGFRLVTRLPERSSATVLLRGGPGAGKTLVGLHVALALAKALGGDVAVGCVEILPSEYVAQLRSARPDLAQTAVVALPGAVGGGAGPRVFCGLLTDLDPGAPDLVASLETLARDVVAAGGKPVVFVVDSLIEGYGIGASAPRTSADAVMKLAAQGGYGLVLCEETHGGASSPWLFTADTVLELGVDARERGRWVEVRKHRFGESVSGQHELDLGGPTVDGWMTPAVFPEPHAWVARHVQGVLKAHGWEFLDDGGIPPLDWDPALGAGAVQGEIEGAFVLVLGYAAEVSRTLAAGLIPAGTNAIRDLIFELDPFIMREEGPPGPPGTAMDVWYVPLLHGPARALRGVIERFARAVEGNRAAPSQRVRRVLLGDLGLVLDAPEALSWVEAVRVFTSLVIQTGRGIPVIAHAARAARGETPANTILSKYPDVCIYYMDEPWLICERWRQRTRRGTWSGLQSAAEKILPLPRPRGREVDRSR